MKTTSTAQQLSSYAIITMGVLALFVLLHLGKTLIIPLGFSFFIGLILYPICSSLEKKGFNRGLAIGLPLGLLVLLVSGLGYLVFALFLELSYDLVNLEPKLIEAFDQMTLFLSETIGISAEKQSEMFLNFLNNAGSKLLNASGLALNMITSGAFFVIMVSIFSYLLLLYRNKLIDTLFNAFPKLNQLSVEESLHDAVHSYYRYIKGMSLVYLSVGLLNSIGLAMIGVPHPFLFGFVASILTIIPYIGIMIASLLPITAAWVAFDSAWYPLAVVGWFIVVQTLEAYFIFPFLVGKMIKINALVMFLTIILGGLLWGAAGMILFIPLISMIKLLAHKSEKYRFVAEFLGD